MSNITIKVENIGKLYRLGEVGTGTISHDLNRWWAKMRGKEDPFSRVGESNDRTQKSSSNYVWAVKDVSFEVKKGEVLGIIGRNGAGKSTLLKLLSKVTQPTEGKIKVAGRIASLLEVGTGFHPEMTGKENIFQNGAILGMTKAEIRSKFDEIVDFAGVERYIDTPVKRYSSGMYVRLAFAVAAFLEPEILIVDEVLAVGDAEFQKKCLGRMKDVSVNDGRTVLFVSHNMAAVKQLCNRAILLENGALVASGDVGVITEKYLRSGITSEKDVVWTNIADAPGNDQIRITRVTAYASGKTPEDPIKSNDIIIVVLEFVNFIKDADLDVTWDIFDIETVHLCHIGTLVTENGNTPLGMHKVSFEIPKDLLNHTRYIFNVTFGMNQRYVIYKAENIISIDVEDAITRHGASYHKVPGIIHPRFSWKVEQIDSKI